MLAKDRKPNAAAAVSQRIVDGQVIDAVVNLDIWRRLCVDASNEIILLLGEATFHQLHGSATGSDTLPLFAAEYEKLRGEPYRSPEREPVLFGTLPPQSRPIMAHLAVLAVKHSPAVNQQR